MCKTNAVFSYVKQEGWVPMGMENQQDESVNLGERQYKFIGNHWKLARLHLKIDFPPQSLSRSCNDILLLLSEQRNPEYMVKSHTIANTS